MDMDMDIGHGHSAKMVKANFGETQGPEKVGNFVRSEFDGKIKTVVISNLF